MNLNCTQLSAVVITTLLSGYALAAEADNASLRRQATERLDVLKTLAEEAKLRGIDTARERVTIVTAQRFLDWSEWDADHPTELRDAIGSWWRVRGQAETLGRELPGRELSDVVRIVEMATRELEAVLDRPESRRVTPPIDHTDLEIVDGYFHHAGRPTFPSTFVWMPRDADLLEAYGNVDGEYIAPAHIKSQGGQAAISYQPGGADESMGRIFFGHSSMPGWAKEAYPGIGIGRRHFTAYDIDHPGTRDVWQALLQDVVPKFAGRKMSQGGYLLANEPHWFSATGEWDTGPVSDFTMAKFRTWLAERHGSIDALNRLWQTDFASFELVSLTVPVDSELRGTPIWYDWCRFNMDRVTDWFTFLHDEVKKHDRGAKTHIKLIPGHFAQGLRSHGLDFESLVRLQEILGCDAKITNAPSKQDADAWYDRYACGWRDLTMTYDFFRSISPTKLLFDSEFHGISTVHWRDPAMTGEYVRCIYWLAHLHGMGMNSTWYWGRDADGSPKRQSIDGFHGSALTQPLVMNAIGRTMKELNAFAPEVVALATQPKPVRLFYSETAAIQEAATMDRIHETYRGLYHLGVPLGFVTEQLLSEASDEALKQWPVVIVTQANYVTAEEIAALSRYLAQSGTVVVLGDDSLRRDAYGRPHVTGLTEGSGRLITIEQAEDVDIASVVRPLLSDAGALPPIRLSESNAVGQSGCVWRTCPWQDGHLLLVINLGKSPAQLQLDADTSACYDLHTGVPHPTSFRLEPLEVRLLAVE